MYAFNTPQDSEKKDDFKIYNNILMKKVFAALK
jgi:hypothetical protein